VICCQSRAIATRYDKTARNFLAAVHLTAGEAHHDRRIALPRAQRRHIFLPDKYMRIAMQRLLNLQC
jgi:hypothetical protein